MTRTLMLTFLRQRANSPIRLILVLMFMVPPALFAIGMQSLSAIGGFGAALGMILAAGAIGQDISSGVLQLLFARPVPRAQYVLSRWLACVVMIATLALVQLAIAAAGMAARGAMPAPLELLASFLENVLSGAAMSALLLMFSAFVGGLGDIAIYFLIFIATQFTGLMAQFKHWDGLHAVTEQIVATMQPKPDLDWLAGHGDPAYTGLAIVLSTTALALAIAITRLSRRELSYAD